jgi:hypothetical protein
MKEKNGMSISGIAEENEIESEQEALDWYETMAKRLESFYGNSGGDTNPVLYYKHWQDDNAVLSLQYARGLERLDDGSYVLSKDDQVYPISITIQKGVLPFYLTGE